MDARIGGCTRTTTSASRRGATIVFKANRPNALWVSETSLVSTQRGLVHAAFAIDVFARRIVG